MKHKLTVFFKKLSNIAAAPTKSHQGDAGWDLYAVENTIIPPGRTKVIKTGIAAAIPEGWYGHIKARSGYSTKGAVVTAGVVDSSYRGEIGVVMVNTSKHHVLTFNKGDRIAQMLILPVPEVEWSEAAELPSTSRDNSGWGSTGK